MYAVPSVRGLSIGARLDADWALSATAETSYFRTADGNPVTFSPQQTFSVNRPNVSIHALASYAWRVRELERVRVLFAPFLDIAYAPAIANAGGTTTTWSQLAVRLGGAFTFEERRFDTLEVKPVRRSIPSILLADEPFVTLPPEDFSAANTPSSRLETDSVLTEQVMIYRLGDSATTNAMDFPPQMLLLLRSFLNELRRDAACSIVLTLPTQLPESEQERATQGVRVMIDWLLRRDVPAPHVEAYTKERVTTDSETDVALRLYVRVERKR
jgi:hypothetical protein